MAGGPAPAWLITGASELEAAKRILVVDDSMTVRKMLAQGLASLGFEVLTASDGAEALIVLRNEPIDLVLTDLNMPNLDGFGLIRAVRAVPSMAILPVIVLTSKEDPVSMRAALDAGANIYLHKPAPLPKLKYKVQSLLADSAYTSRRFTETLKFSPPGAGRQPLKASARTRALAPEVHLETYLLAGSETEAAEELAALLDREDTGPNVVLPLMLDNSIGDVGRIRLFRLMAAQRREDYTLPLLHKYYDFENPLVKLEIVKAVRNCGGPEFLPDLKEMYESEIKMGMVLDNDHRALFQAFDEAITQLQAVVAEEG